MPARLGAVLCCVALTFVNAPAAAADSWSCTYKNLTIGPDVPGEAKIRIDGEWLDWIVDVPVVGPMGEPVPVPGHSGEYQHKPMTFRNQLLENNDAGIVAVTSQSHLVSGIGPLVGATVISIGKSNGDFRMGSVMAGDVQELMSGYCTPNPDTPRNKVGH